MSQGSPTISCINFFKDRTHIMKELFLLKLGEIVLKGQNRRVFED